MANGQELQAQEKRELQGKDEPTIPARTFVPTTDIYETEQALTVVMEMPGVGKTNLDINVENDVLSVTGASISQIREAAASLHGVQHRALSAEL